MCVLSLVMLIACGTDSKKKEVEKEVVKKEQLNVISVNYPLHYFAERIGGNLVKAVYPIPNNVDPAYWIPQDSTLMLYQNAEVILSNGADYAKWMQNVSLPSSRIVNTTASIKDKLIEVEQGASHSHGDQGEHVHMGYAFTTWLNFEMAQTQAEAVKEALVAKRPEDKVLLEANYKKLNSELAQLHTEMLTIGEQLHDQGLIGSHPVYQYLAKAYHLHMSSVHFEPSEMPTKKQWHDFDHEVSHHPAKIMLWEGEPLAEVKAKIEAKGVKVVVFNPCGNKPSSGDFISVMRANVQNLKP